MSESQQGPEICDVISRKRYYSKCMTEIQGKSILVRVSTRFELARVRVIGSRLYFYNIVRWSSMLKQFCKTTKNIEKYIYKYPYGQFWSFCMVIFQPTRVVHLTVRIISTFIFLFTFHEQVCLHVFINYRKFSFVSRTHCFVSLGLPLVHGKGQRR